MSFYLAIVSPLDTPLFELSLTSSKPGPPPSSTFPSWSTFGDATTSTPTSSAGGRPGSGQLGGGGVGHAGTGAGGGGGIGGGGGQGGAGAGVMAGVGAGVPGSLNLGLVAGAAGEKHLLQMVAHAALDSVEEVAEGTGSLYLKSVDRHNEWIVSAFLATNVKLILLHDTKNDDGIRLFFGDVWETYVKVALNPFQTVNTPIRNPLFEAKVRASARKYL